MSSTLQKIADKLTGKDKEYDDRNSSNYGPHSTNTANKLDPKVDSDLDGRNDPSSRVGGYGNTQATDRYGTTTGPGGLTSSDTYGSRANNPAHDNYGSTNYGPHSSNLANKLDPRVDSDRDNRNDPTSHVGGRGHTQDAHDSYVQSTGPGGIGSTTTSTHRTGALNTHTGPTGTSGYGTTTTGYDDPSSTNSGPHSSNILNKLDPRVDSDRDGRNDPTSRTGGFGHTQTGYAGGPTATHSTSTHGTHNTGTTGYGTGTTYDDPRSTNEGPHSSNLMNKLDPRVDSDRDGRNDPTSRTGGYGHTQTGYAGDSTATHSTGTHKTHIGTAGTTGYGTNTGYDDPRSTNEGPHSSNLMNKLDPRVDSDRDGRNDPSSRVGGYGTTQTGTGYSTGPTTSTGYTGTEYAHDNPQSTNTGPHSSNLLNKLDPRVDSDRDGRNDPTSRTGGYGQTQTGTGTGGIARY